MTARRSFLQKVGIAGVATAAGVAILPGPPESAPMAQASDDDGDGGSPIEDLPWTQTVIEDESTAPVARFQYRADGDSFEPTAPINVVFALADSPDGLPAVMAVLEDAGWIRVLEEYTRYAWDRDTEEYVLQEATAAETYYGTSGRLHVRCWEFEGVVSMQAHEDAAARPYHTIASYARGRRAIESLFRAEGWNISPRALELDNERDPDHDGSASVIRPGESG